MRKPRSDSPLKTLPLETREEIAQLCYQMGFGADTIAAVKELTGLRAGVSASALQRFYAWQRVESALERTRDDAATFEELLTQSPDLALDAERARAVGQLYFERRVLSSEDPELYFAWLKERRADEAQRLERERLALEKGKFERLVLDKLDDLLKARAAAESKGLRGEAAVDMVRRALWGDAVEGVG